MEQALSIKDENRTVANHLLNYHDELKIYEDKLNNFKMLGAMVYSDMPKGTDVGNPTLNKAMQANELQERKDWLDVVELTESTLSEKSKAYLNFRRLAKDIEFESTGGRRKTWIDHVAKQYAEWQSNRYGVEYCEPTKMTMYNWMNNIIYVTVRIAIEKGCL
jgi:hypothetical protein